MRVSEGSCSVNCQTRELEEKKYLFEATKNDGSYYTTVVLDVNGLHDDVITPIDSITCDWWVQFK